jgi:hypothetical protein
MNCDCELEPYTEAEAIRFNWFRDYCHTLTHDNDISLRLIRTASACYEITKPEMPTLREIAAVYLEQRICNHIDFIPDRYRITIMNILLSWSMQPWSCNDIEIMYAYYLSERTFPQTIDEFMSFLDRGIQAMTDPTFESFSSKTVEIDLSKFLTNFAARENGPNDVCCLCQDNIVGEQTIYKFPCGHIFHATKDNCLGDSTVEDWFKRKNTCPLCRLEVV